MIDKYNLKWLTVCLACPLIVHADSGVAPNLQMVIFEENNDNRVENNKPVNGSGANGQMQMVIFSDAPQTQQTGSRLAANNDSGGISVTNVNQPEPETYNHADKDQPEDDYQMEFYVQGGYRQDDVDWNIAYPTGVPNIVSELQWKNVESAMFETGIAITYAENWHAEGQFGYGAIVDGDNQDSDYDLNDRQGEFSRSYSVTDDGATIDVSGGLGYHFTIGNKDSTPRIRLTPKAGFAFHTQQFNDTNGVQVIPAYGNFGGLDSTYDSTWYGPWGGLATRFVITRQLSLDGSIEYHWANYEGTGNWNLRDDFQHPKSFEQEADGDGVVASAGARYLFSPEWAVRLTADYQRWKANNNGKNTFHFANGFIVESRYNEVNWDSYGFNLGMEYKF